MKIEDCFGSLRGGFEKWRDYFANPRFCCSRNTVAWYDFRESRLSAVLGADEFSLAAERGQYSFQLIEDGSLVRLGYSYDARGRELRAASLSLIRAPSDEVMCRGNPNSSFGESGYLGLCNWLRIDFDPDAANGPTHMACHLHISSLPNARIPLSRLPTPGQFISWVVAIAFPDAFKEMVARNEHFAINAPSFVQHWEPDLAPFFYLSIPPKGAPA